MMSTSFGAIMMTGGLCIVDEQQNFDLLAASLRADMSDMHTWFAVLGGKLAGALPTRVRVRREGMFGRGNVEGVEVDLGEWRYILRLERGHPVGERTHIVRGIALKTEPLALDAWIDDLAESLAALAASSARENQAIQRLLQG